MRQIQIGLRFENFEVFLPNGIYKQSLKYLFTIV
jgi:hypothetical protein